MSRKLEERGRRYITQTLHEQQAISFTFVCFLPNYSGVKLSTMENIEGSIGIQLQDIIMSERIS